MESEVSHQRNFKSAELANIYIYKERDELLPNHLMFVYACWSFPKIVFFFFLHTRDHIIVLKKRFQLMFRYTHKRS